MNERMMEVNPPKRVNHNRRPPPGFSQVFILKRIKSCKWSNCRSVGFEWVATFFMGRVGAGKKFRIGSGGILAGNGGTRDIPYYNRYVLLVK